MHLLTEEHILLLLVQIGLLLGCARALGELFRRMGQPSITAEIIVGICFGPTIFGRLSPTLHARIFPADPAQMKMFGAIAWLGILFFLLKAGLETNFATAWRQRRNALKLSMCDLTIPMLIAFIPCFFLPARYMGAEGGRLIFSLFIAVIMTISALPVTARVLQDLKIYRTDLGLLIMSALTINDVAGWIVFALILGMVTGVGMSLVQMGSIVLLTVAFAVFCLTLGSKLFDRTLRFLQKERVPDPAGSLTLVVLAGLLGGIATTWIGIHALFGFFIAGIMAGESKRLSERTRHVFDQMVQAVLVPLFFTAIGLKLDFLGNFDLFLVIFILGIGWLGRYGAAYIGSRLIGQPSLQSRLIADAHIPGGEMQIVIGMLALEYGVISETVYVAVVFGAIFTAVISGPLMGKILRRIEQVDWLSFLTVDRVSVALAARNREAAIRELCACLHTETDEQSVDDILQAVLAREQEMTTAIGGGVAVPHARIPNLKRSLVALGCSRQALEWNSADGKPVQLIFLVITPHENPSIQLQLLRGISSGVANPDVRAKLIQADSSPEAMEILRQWLYKSEQVKPV
ncbi:MAG: cation:proton antiporter [Kiritimatiellia bacterium]|nr:cation:proton antiporter [Kiritimatiellia bacterium]